MEEKKTIVDFIKENKKVIGKGVIILTGLAAGVFIISRLGNGGEEILETIGEATPDEIGQVIDLVDIN